MSARVLVVFVVLFFVGIGLFAIFELKIFTLAEKEKPNPKIVLGLPSPLNETGSPRYELSFSTLKNNQLEFTPVSVPIHRHQLFDFGVADINQDGLLDLFSSNCNFRPSILLNLGNLSFKNVTTELQLNLQPDLPDFACNMSPPEITETGLYIFYHWWGKVNIYYLPLKEESFRTVKVEMFIPHTRTDITETRGSVAIVTNKQKITDTIGETTEKITMENESLAVINIDRPAIPVKFSVQNTFPLEKIFIGPGKTSPTEHTFTLNTFDRHSYSWADVNGDGRMDVFSGRGGLRGTPEYEELRKQMKDQLFINRGHHFENIYDTSGLINCGCGTRKSCWINIDNDEHLELFIICAREEVCRLFRKYDTEGKYKECVGEYGLDIIGEQPFFWFDINNDGYIDLLTFSNNQPTIFINQSGNNFRKHTIAGRNDIEFNPVFLSASDFNNDGNMEFLFANLPDHRTFILQHKGGTEFEWLSPEDFHLPETSFWGCWGDLNNDRYDEFLSIPEGIYLNQHGKTFTNLNLLNLTHIQKNDMSDARIQCFDIDNDGKQDIMMGYRIKGENPSGYGEWWYLTLFRNISQSANWFGVEIQGHTGNPHGFATSILCKYDGNNRKLRIVGETGHSRANQGNYRLHFGLSTDEEIPPLFIITPQGEQLIPKINKNTYNIISLAY